MVNLYGCVSAVQNTLHVACNHMTEKNQKSTQLLPMGNIHDCDSDNWKIRLRAQWESRKHHGQSSQSSDKLVVCMDAQLAYRQIIPKCQKQEMVIHAAEMTRGQNWNKTRQFLLAATSTNLLLTPSKLLVQTPIKKLCWLPRLETVQHTLYYVGATECSFLHACMYTCMQKTALLTLGFWHCDMSPGEGRSQG